MAPPWWAASDDPGNALACRGAPSLGMTSAITVLVGRYRSLISTKSSVSESYTA